MDISATHLRAARAALFTALCVTLSAASHVLLSGVPIPVTVVGALSATVFAIAYALAGRERGFWQIAALMVPLELAADTAFTSGQHACYGPTGGPVTGPLRVVGVDFVCAGGGVGSPLTHLSGGAPMNGVGVSPWLLLTAHVAVGLAAAAWLRRGEAALGQLLRAIATFAFRPLLMAVAAVAAATSAERPPVRPVHRDRTAPALPLLVHSVVRRGPPRCPTPAV
ncbi:hypothetical protein LRS74_25630 [Streptomyces sp. LX-29]|uniref:hypothetical protein n=1 Tax=Streptomyces sp. LX-29 TaxID=2900152 RepID=UPI00240D0AD3|nr:hypothetical protein [Streptomyces sp. LX-29]WFB10044.1 hypothetical protein LRS74_25630 [Streptomyces sp. LX-29]